MKRTHLSPVTSLLVSLSLVAGILVCDLAGSLPSAHAQTGARRVLSVAVPSGTLSGTMIVAKGVVINGVATDAVFLGGVGISDSHVLGAFPSGEIDPVNGAFPSGEIDPANGAFPSGEIDPVNGAFPSGEIDPVSGAFPSGEVEPANGAFPSGEVEPVELQGAFPSGNITAGASGLQVIGGTLQGSNIRVINGMITGDNLVLVGAYVTSRGGL